MPNSHAEPLTQRFDQRTRPKALHYRLKFQGGLSYKQISEVTSLTVTNVGFLIHTGLKTLRQRLSAEQR